MELLTDIENEVIEKTKDYLQDSYLKSDNFTYIKAFLDYIKSEKDIFKILLCQKESISFQDIFINEMLEHLQETIPSNYPTATQKYAYCYIMKGSINIIIEWINSDFDISSDMLAKLILDLSLKITN